MESKISQAVPSMAIKSISAKFQTKIGEKNNKATLTHKGFMAFHAFNHVIESIAIDK